MVNKNPPMSTSTEMWSNHPELLSTFDFSKVDFSSENFQQEIQEFWKNNNLPGIPTVKMLSDTATFIKDYPEGSPTDLVIVENNVAVVAKFPPPPLPRSSTACRS